MCRGSATHPGSLMVMAIGCVILQVMGAGVAPSYLTEQTRRSSDPLALHCSSIPTS